jgi:hypothetical protein
MNAKMEASGDARPFHFLLQANLGKPKPISEVTGTKSAGGGWPKHRGQHQ